ncbi:MAG: LuxR family transcriptional regulator [Acidimicrobiaceae bacterium]|nr:LuxR family transcriptional regulator [Acidimicrobiaceae bacterium]
MVNLLGRRAERDAVEGVLSGASAGQSGALVVRGEAGIGKSALLEQARHDAVSAGFRVEYVVGSESEAQLGFAGLHQLCAPVLDHAGALPEPQQAALEVAFGLRDGTAPDRFLVGLAMLNLLAEIAEDAPLLCLVDDAQWLDQVSSQVLAFVARRLEAERVAMLFGVRDSTDGGVAPFDGLPELRLGGLSETEARDLLAAEVRAPLDDRIRDRIISEARGNPLALLELPRGSRAAGLTTGFEVPDALDVPQRVEREYQRRSGSLPADTQLLLLLAAADPTGDAELLWRAAAHLGIARESAGAAESSGLLELDSRVRFRHPLVRSAVYRAATPHDRRRAHGALATATDARDHPDRRAWHRAQAASETDEEAAADLEHSADRARARGGLAAAAMFLERATELTPDPAERSRRALDAASVMQEAGAFEAALDLLNIADSGPLDPHQHARLGLMRAEIAFHVGRDSDVPGMLLDAAEALAPLDAALSRDTYLRAIDRVIVTGGHGRGVMEVAEASRAAPAPPGPPGPVDLLLAGLTTTYTDGYAEGVPELRRALEAFCADGPPAEATDDIIRRWPGLASRAALMIFDDELLNELTQRTVQLARDAGALATLPVSLLLASSTLVLEGKLSRASELISEAEAITQITGAVPLRFGALSLTAARGQQTETLAIHAAAVHEAGARGNGAEVALANLKLSVFHNGQGDFAAALDAAEKSCESFEPPHTNLGLPELIEAAAGADQLERATAAVDELSRRARAAGTPWALGLAARSRALTSTGAAAEEHYREAIDVLGDCRMVSYLARTHLVYGEWLRRERRRQEAREHLRTAHELLSDMGAEGFAARAGQELRAIGEHPRARTARPTDALTDHELHVARLVATGATSREVGAQLFLSPRTIEAHLRSIFRKLDITSRRQLRDFDLQ